MFGTVHAGETLQSSGHRLYNQQRSRLYRVWTDMIQRRTDETDRDYYGVRWRSQDLKHVRSNIKFFNFCGVNYLKCYYGVNYLKCYELGYIDCIPHKSMNDMYYLLNQSLLQKSYRIRDHMYIDLQSAYSQDQSARTHGLFHEASHGLVIVYAAIG